MLAQEEFLLGRLILEYFLHTSLQTQKDIENIHKKYCQIILTDEETFV